MGFRSTALGAVVLAALAACGGVNAFRLDDQVALFHDDLRWGRMPAAEQQVTDRMRARFQRVHAGWGTDVRIVDLELTATRVIGNGGFVRARYLWTRADEVDTRESLVETHWRVRPDGSWVCDDERVIGGDASLLVVR